MLLLKSKNKIKRFSNRTKREEKLPAKPKQHQHNQQYQSTSSGLGATLELHGTFKQSNRHAETN
jgi:hypothetical protein